MTNRRLLSIAGIVGPVLYIGSFVVVGHLRADYSFVANSISDLSEAYAPFRPVLIATFSIYNALSVVFALRLAILVKDNGRSNRIGYWAAALVALVGVAETVRVGFFPMERIGVPQAVQDYAHTGLAGVGFLSGIGALFLFSSWFDGAGIEERWVRYAYFTAWVLVCAVIATAVGTSLQTPWMAWRKKWR